MAVAQQSDLQPVDWITVEGFRSVRSIRELPLARLNVMIGVNGAGKSNVLKAFSFLQAISAGAWHLGQHIMQAGGANRFIHFGPAVTDHIRLAVSVADGASEYTVQFAPAEDGGLYPTLENMICTQPDGSRNTFDLNTGRVSLTLGDPDYRGNAYEAVEYLRDQIVGWQVHHFHDTTLRSPMKRTADVHDNRALRHDGENLAAFLYMLRASWRGTYDLIVNQIRRVMPFFEDFVLVPSGSDGQWIRLAWKHRHSKGDFDVSTLPDGGLRFIHLTTLLLQPPELMPSVILVDEPELGLHPAALYLLANLLQDASDHAQIVLATQSSPLVDELEPEDVLVAELRDGATDLTRLSTANLSEWLKDYTLGQLWERNQFGGVPYSDPPPTS